MGRVGEPKLPSNHLARLQIVEYFRAFLFGRVGWAAVNALPLVSGAFGMFARRSILAVGGYCTDAIGEDMELVIRLHRHFRERRIRYRIAFVPEPGYLMLAADYSQIELRIMSHLSGDETLLKAFSEGQDIHRATAAKAFGVAPGEVSGEQRRSAKAINFGLIYGMSAFGLAKQLGVERGTAQEYIDLYFDRYPGVREFMDNIREKALEVGYVETVFGRRLYLPEINARYGQRCAAAERTAINAPMQGTAADIIKTAMIEVYAWLKSSAVAADLIMQVHDELVLEVDKKAVDAVQKELVAIMESAADLDVPLAVDVGLGKDWDEAH